jgi:hypothetical protein
LLHCRVFPMPYRLYAPLHGQTSPSFIIRVLSDAIAHVRFAPDSDRNCVSR